MADRDESRPEPEAVTELGDNTDLITPVEPLMYECNQKCLDENGNPWRTSYWIDMSGKPCPEPCEGGVLVRSGS